MIRNSTLFVLQTTSLCPSRRALDGPPNIVEGQETLWRLVKTTGPNLQLLGRPCLTTGKSHHYSQPTYIISRHPNPSPTPSFTNQASLPCSRVSPKAPYVMTKHLPPIFLFHFGPDLIFFLNFSFGIFSMSSNFWPLKNKHREIAKSCPEKSHRFWRCEVFFTKKCHYYYCHYCYCH